MKDWFRKIVGSLLYRVGVKPCHSTGICGAMTCGYGVLSSNGYWQYPVIKQERELNQELKEKGAND
jgi:hypothetical protein